MRPIKKTPPPPRELTFKEKVVEMIGWGSCTRTTNQDLTLTSTDAPLMTPVRPMILAQAGTDQNGKCPLPKLNLSGPPAISTMSVMPRTRR